MVSTVQNRMNGRIRLQCFWRSVLAKIVLAKLEKDVFNLRRAQTMAMCLGSRIEKRKVFTAFRIMFIALSSSVEALRTVRSSKRPKRLDSEDSVDLEGSNSSNCGQHYYSRKKDRLGASRLDFQSVQFQRHLSLLELGGAFRLGLRQQRGSARQTMLGQLQLLVAVPGVLSTIDFFATRW